MWELWKERKNVLSLWYMNKILTVQFQCRMHKRSKMKILVISFAIWWTENYINWGCPMFLTTRPWQNHRQFNKILNQPAWNLTHQVYGLSWLIFANVIIYGALAFEKQPWETVFHTNLQKWILKCMTPWVLIWGVELIIWITISEMFRDKWSIGLWRNTLENMIEKLWCHFFRLRLCQFYAKCAFYTVLEKSKVKKVFI